MSRCSTILLLVLLTVSSARAQTTTADGTTLPQPPSTTTAPDAEATPEPAVASPAPPPASPSEPAAAPQSDIDWLRAGVGIGSFVLQQSGFSFAPGLSAVVEACPSDVMCLFGSARGTASTYPNASGVIGGAGVPFASTSLVSLALNVGGRYVLSPGAPVEVSPWLSLGLGGGFAEGTSLSTYDPVTGALLPTQSGLFGTSASLTAGVLAEREMWDGVRVRVSTSLLSGSVAWSLSSAGGAGSSDLSFAADLVLQPSFAVLLEL